MKNKKFIIHSMITLLNFAKQFPIFMANYDIEANNEDIEKYLIANVDIRDWQGNKRKYEDIEKDKKYVLEHFHRSKGYNKNGKSKITMQFCWNVNNITFDSVRKIVNGEHEQMPKNYSFIGNFRLTNDQNL